MTFRGKEAVKKTIILSEMPRSELHRFGKGIMALSLD